MPKLKASFPKSRSLCLKLLLALGLFAALLFTPSPARAFALLGPFEPWMQFTNGLRQPGDIGGPMDIGNGYRWNVPIVTYGFDQSFLDFFGTNGVAAVQSAIQILNDLPPASQTVLTNYRLNRQRYNYTAANNGLMDLKSKTLAILLEQLGLAQPSRYCAFLKQWSPVFLEYRVPNESTYWDWAYPDFITSRNFDPITLMPSQSVDGTLYGNYMEYFGSYQFIENVPDDPTAIVCPAVADQNSVYTLNVDVPGQLILGLTEDDVGGLCYLYSTNNIAYENLLADVRKNREHHERLVRVARRPGIDKLTFVPHPTEGRTDRFVPYVYSYDDKYTTNGTLVTQSVERVVSKPDFLFTARTFTNPYDDGTFFYDRTGTTNWSNNATLNASSEGGPGVITPQVKITFNTVGHYAFSDSPFSAIITPSTWGSFDDSTNAPVAYPISSKAIKPYLIIMWLYLANGTIQPYQWRVTDSIGSVSVFQTSTNMVNWVTTFSATNDGASWYLFNENPLAGQQFFRVIPQ